MPNAGTGTMNGTFAASINDSGIVAGTYADTSQVYHGFVLTPTASATISLSPTSLSFGDQAVDTTSTSKTVTVTNTGTATVDLTSVVITAGNSYFASSRRLRRHARCGQEVHGEGHVHTRATGCRDRNAHLHRQCFGQPASGIAVGNRHRASDVDALQLYLPQDQSRLDQRRQEVTLKNNLSTTLTGLSYSTKAPFAISTSTCTTTLSSKKSCTISVTFSPTATGTKTGTLTVSDSANNSPQTASLSGTGD